MLWKKILGRKSVGCCLDANSVGFLLLSIECAGNRLHQIWFPGSSDDGVARYHPDGNANRRGVLCATSGCIRIEFFL